MLFRSGDGAFPGTDGRGYAFAAPDFGPDGRVRGVLVVTVSFGALEQNWRGTLPAVFFTIETGEVLVTNRSEMLNWTKAAGDRDRMALVNDLIFVITPDAAVRFAKVRSGECQIARYPNPGDLAAMKTEPTINLLQGSIADQSFLAFNQQKKPFGDRRVREALAYATNIPAIIDSSDMREAAAMPSPISTPLTALIDIIAAARSVSSLP